MNTRYRFGFGRGPRRPEDILLRPVDEYVRKFGEDASRLRVIRAHTVCRPAVGVPASLSAAEARESVLRANERTAYVLDGSGRPTGSISIDRLTGADGSDSVEAIMESSISHVHESALMEDIVKMLVATDGHVAVVDDDGALVGEVDEKAVLGCMLTDTPSPELERIAV